MSSLRLALKLSLEETKDDQSKKSVSSLGNTTPVAKPRKRSNSNAEVSEQKPAKTAKKPSKQRDSESVTDPDSGERINYE